MTEEIKYNKDEKWVSYKQLAETPQQTIARLEQENKELKEKVNFNLKRGYKISSTSCGFVDSAEYDYCSVYQDFSKGEVSMTEEKMTTGEKFYCLIQDIEEYMQHNNLEQDKELDFILNQSEKLQSDYARLEQENKELKEANQSLSILGTDLASAFETVRKEFFRADKNKDMWREKAEKYRSALEEILESAKFAQCLPCGSGNLEDCLNCDDDTTNNGQFCMEKRIHDIKTKCVEVLNHSEG